jgi:hypothetical protein
VAVEFPRKGLTLNRFSGERLTQWSSVNRIELPFPSRTVEWLIYHSTVHRFESESSVGITADAVPVRLEWSNQRLVAWQPAWRDRRRYLPSRRHCDFDLGFH